MNGTRHRNRDKMRTLAVSFNPKRVQKYILEVEYIGDRPPIYNAFGGVLVSTKFINIPDDQFADVVKTRLANGEKWDSPNGVPEEFSEYVYIPYNERYMTKLRRFMD